MSLMSLMSRLMRTWILHHRRKNHRKKILRKKNLMNSFLSKILNCFQHFSLLEQNSFLNYN
jgi:hypothetical protein